MKILLSGATGLIGSEFARQAHQAGSQTVALTRDSDDPRNILWDPMSGRVRRGDLDGFDAVVHLAGEPIGDGRWSEAKKGAIRESRVTSTANLARLLSETARPPRVFVTASAVGFYGDRGDTVLNENSGAGTGFLPDVCRDWEAAAQAASACGIRVAHARFGAVLGAGGGMLGKIKGPFSFGLGGPLGDGRQWMSWISVVDVGAALHHVISTTGLSGPVNVVSPHPVTNAEFTATLAAALHRPAFLRVPRAVARLAFGEMADAVLFASARVRPEALLSTGFQYAHAELAPALRALFARQ